MKLYRCKVRLAGKITNEVPKINVTAAEIMLLRLIHGGEDGVIAIEETGEDKRRTSEGERARLRTIYRDVIAKTDENEIDPIMKLFGPDHLPLPKEVKKPETVIATADEVASLLG